MASRLLSLPFSSDRCEVSTRGFDTRRIVCPLSTSSLTSWLSSTFVPSLGDRTWTVRALMIARLVTGNSSGTTSHQRRVIRASMATEARAVRQA